MWDHHCSWFCHNDDWRTIGVKICSHLSLLLLWLTIAHRSSNSQRFCHIFSKAAKKIHFPDFLFLLFQSQPNHLHERCRDTMSEPSCSWRMCLLMESNKREKKLYNINSWGRLREGVKNEYFTVRLTIRGGGSHFGPDRKQMWKFWPIFYNGIWLFDTQNTFYLIVRGLKIGVGGQPLRSAWL